MHTTVCAALTADIGFAVTGQSPESQAADKLEPPLTQTEHEQVYYLPANIPPMTPTLEPIVNDGSTMNIKLKEHLAPSMEHEGLEKQEFHGVSSLTVPSQSNHKNKKRLWKRTKRLFTYIIVCVVRGLCFCPSFL